MKMKPIVGVAAPARVTSGPKTPPARVAQPARSLVGTVAQRVTGARPVATRKKIQPVPLGGRQRNRATY